MARENATIAMLWARPPSTLATANRMQAMAKLRAAP